MWTTAYVGCQLADLRSSPSAGVAVRRAASWLTRRELTGGGWGYDENVGCDADSTAYALLLLRRARSAVHEQSCVRLEGFQRCDGGFSTYGAADGLGSWGISHPDVTPVAAHALLLTRGSAHPAIGLALDYVKRHRNHAGLWNSFWWSTPLYATRSSLDFLACADAQLELAPTRAALLEHDPGSPFERALLLDCLRFVGDATRARRDELVETLLSDQVDDGSWSSVPTLRIPSRTCEAPWTASDAGVLYSDRDRLFTTATVLGALTRATLSVPTRRPRTDSAVAHQ